ncbi:MAG: hypothetical protein WC679_13315 [Bacteroidales bacterium]|jgi:hypothetical protein
MKKIRSIQPLKVEKLKSPNIVLLMDKIRFELENCKNDQFNEICWFLREYPRIFRHHLECLEYRLENIHAIYIDAYNKLNNKLDNLNDELNDLKSCILSNDEMKILPNAELWEMSFSDIKTKVMYWEFESLLSAANISLDIMTRILSTAFKEQLPPNFNKACKKEEDSNGIIAFMKSEKDDWVSSLKDYRDCFTHCIPVDTLLSIKAIKEDDEWFIYGKLPINPNERDITRFDFDYKNDVLKYSIFIYEKVKYFEEYISLKIENMYSTGLYPVRINNLFSVGRREKI